MIHPADQYPAKIDQIRSNNEAYLQSLQILQEMLEGHVQREFPEGTDNLTSKEIRDFSSRINGYIQFDTIGDEQLHNGRALTVRGIPFAYHLSQGSAEGILEMGDNRVIDGQVLQYEVGFVPKIDAINPPPADTPNGEWFSPEPFVPSIVVTLYSITLHDVSSGEYVSKRLKVSDMSVPLVYAPFIRTLIDS